ncbi:hypothetical protein FACS189494_08390 [Spirochaetia bacterium]|nr:hypothetical protein FACS189494_08390 [Spirochaetia bacterium]
MSLQIFFLHHRHIGIRQKINGALCCGFMLAALFSGCKKTAKTDLPSVSESIGNRVVPAINASSNYPAVKDEETFSSVLDMLAETERNNGYVQGMGLSESSFREKNGDFSGAVIAAFKEIAWTYSYMNLSNDPPPITKATIKDGLEKIKTLYDGNDYKTAVAAAEASILFIDGHFDKSKIILSELFTQEVAPDSFPNWMRLVCGLEDGEVTHAEKEVYSSIRARYAAFPAYWYYGARNFTGGMAADFAERCINLAPHGPYSGEARKILASFMGVQSKDIKDFLTRKEIEEIISKSVSASDPELLSPLLPLIALRDNQFTLNISDSLRKLSSNNSFKAWFVNQETIAIKRFGTDNRLVDRLRYITRG